MLQECQGNAIIGDRYIKEWIRMDFCRDTGRIGAMDPEVQDAVDDAQVGGSFATCL